MPTKKKHQLFADPEFTFENTFILMMQSSLMGHELIIALNDIYDLRLARNDDVDINGLLHPCYSYYNDETRQSFVVINKPMGQMADPAFAFYNSILLIRGSQAKELQLQIYNDLTGTSIRPEEHQLREMMYWEKGYQLYGHIVAIDTFDFSKPGEPETSMHLNPLVPMSSATVSYLKKLVKFLGSAFETILYELEDLEEDTF